MSRETMATDVRYALGQLQRVLGSGAVGAATDAARRAIDALERVEAGLAGPGNAAASDAYLEQPGSERGLPCDTGLESQLGERGYDYGCYGT